MLSHGGPLRFVAAALVLIAAVGPGAAFGSELCSRSGDMVTVSVPPTSSISFIREHEELRISIGGQPLSGDCAGLTEANTSAVAIVLGSGLASNYRDVIVDLSGGMFGIPVHLGDLGEPEPTLEIWGTTGADTIVLGTLGASFDPDSELDLTFSPTAFQGIHVAADLGDDIVSAAGGQGTGDPMSIHVNLVGNEGNDQLEGGSFHDLIDGRDGFDVVRGGLGGDFCWEAEEEFSCENPVEEGASSWHMSCRPGVVAAECSGGGRGDDGDGELGGGVTLRGTASGLLPAGGRVIGTGVFPTRASVDEPSRSISIRTFHEVSWADIDIRDAAGSATVVLTVRAYNLDCPVTCNTSISRTIVDSTNGPVRVQRDQFRLDLTMTNGDEMIPRSEVYVDVILTIQAELGVFPVPSPGSVHATATMGLNSIAIYPDQS